MSVVPYAWEAIQADFKTAPYIHQLREFEASAELPARALLWQMRTGKTKITIDTACHNARYKDLDAIIVLAPNGVHENWIRRELPVHHWDTVPRDTLTWRTDIAGKLANPNSLKRKGWEAQHTAFWDRASRVLASDKLTWFSFASETVTRKDVRNLIARILRRKKRIMLVIDESDDYGKAGSKKTMMVRALAKKCAIRRILSGTVVENSPLRAYSQYEMLEEGALGFDTYGAFKDHHATYVTKKNRNGRAYPVLDEYRNLEQLRYRMSKLSSVVLREDCHDLPALIPELRRVTLTDQQVTTYRELLATFLLDLNGEEVSVGENTSKLIKLQQVVSGFVKDEFGDMHIIPGANPRLEALVDEVNLTGGKVIIWCAFRDDMDFVAKALHQEGHKYVSYHGRVSSADKALARKAFEPGESNDVKALIGHPQSGGRGLDLSGADKIIWYSHTFNAITRSQADERATAMGGTNIPVVDLVAPGVDEYILANVAEKVEIADAIARTGMKEILSKISLVEL